MLVHMYMHVYVCMCAELYDNSRIDTGQNLVRIDKRLTKVTSLQCPSTFKCYHKPCVKSIHSALAYTTQELA